MRCYHEEHIVKGTHDGNTVLNHSLRTSCSVDVAHTWRSALNGQHRERLYPDGDRRFWEHFAERYDDRVSVPGSFAQTLAWLESAVHSTETLLDVGAGTGRFALPLAERVKRITALDYSPAMLRILEGNALQAGIRNITTVTGNWPEIKIEEHDVVLVAWALYRQRDIERSLIRLIEVTGRRLIIALSGAYDAPHRRMIQSLRGQDSEPVEPLHLYLLGTLWQLGLRANLEILSETRSFSFKTLDEALGIIGPSNLRGEEVTKARDALESILVRDNTGLTYSFEFPVAILHWNREEDR
jgi:SAM-dependent methyltransferase